MSVRISDRNDWFDLWFEDKQALISTMTRNMAADLEAGYNYFGNSIRRQVEDLEAFKAQFDAEMDSFKLMDEKAVNRWCFYDLKKRGAIE